MKGDPAIDKLRIKKHLKPNNRECYHYNRCHEEISRFFEEQRKLEKHFRLKNKQGDR